MPQIDELLFIYNADAGIFSVVSDFAHKILSPKTYACNLCKLTYGAFTMKNEWKEYLEQLPFKKTFLHKDEFHRKFPRMTQLALPAVIRVQNGEPREFLTATEISAQTDLVGLRNLVEKKLRTYETA